MESSTICQDMYGAHFRQQRVTGRDFQQIKGNFNNFSFHAYHIVRLVAYINQGSFALQKGYLEVVL